MFRVLLAACALLEPVLCVALSVSPCVASWPLPAGSPIASCKAVTGRTTNGGSGERIGGTPGRSSGRAAGGELARNRRKLRDRRVRGGQPCAVDAPDAVERRAALVCAAPGLSPDGTSAPGVRPGP